MCGEVIQKNERDDILERRMRGCRLEVGEREAGSWAVPCTYLNKKDIFTHLRVAA